MEEHTGYGAGAYDGSPQGGGAANPQDGYSPGGGGQAAHLQQGGYALLPGHQSRADAAQAPGDYVSFQDTYHRARLADSAVEAQGPPLLQQTTFDTQASGITDGHGDSQQRQFNKARVAAGRAVQILMKKEALGPLLVSRTSVYGIALVMPQIARSAGYSRSFLGLAIRNLLHLMLNIFLQVAVLHQICLSLNVMTAYGSQPHLCNFGAKFDQCPGSPDCTGPGGTQYSKFFLFASFQEWHNRKSVRDALLNVAPERASVINSQIHVGEWGVESPLCRFIFVFLFVIEIIEDWTETHAMIKLLKAIPTADESWLSYEPPTWTHKGQIKEIFGHNELDFVKFRIRGMPLRWKIANYFIIIIPKTFIWLVLLTSGVQFLMETAPIGDLIINGLAMGFILQIDELIGSRLCTSATKTVMEKIEGYHRYDRDEHESKEDHEVMEEYDAKDQQWKLHNPSLWMLLLPRRLITILIVTGIAYSLYFWRFCEKKDDGSYVSKPLHPPVTISRLGPWMLEWLFYPWGIERVALPTWAMPKAAET